MNSNDVAIFNEVRSNILSRLENLERMYGEYARRLNEDEQKKLIGEINRITETVREELKGFRIYNVVDIESLHASKLYHHFNSKTIKIDDLAEENNNYGEVKSLTPVKKINKSGSFLQDDQFSQSFMGKYYKHNSQVDHVISSFEVESIQKHYFYAVDLLSVKKKIYALQNFFSILKKRSQFKMSNKIEKIIALDSLLGTKYININDLTIFQFQNSKRRRLENIINDRFIAIKELAK